jgi:hypothetical protein
MEHIKMTNLQIVKESKMEKKDRLDIIRNTIVETMIDNYKNYGNNQGMSETEIEALINENLMSVSMMADMVAEKIESKIFAEV